MAKRLPFAFLEDARQQFTARYGAVAGGAVAYEMSTEFAPVLRDRMRFFSTDPRWAAGWLAGCLGSHSTSGAGPAV